MRNKRVIRIIIGLVTLCVLCVAALLDDYQAHAREIDCSPTDIQAREQLRIGLDAEHGQIRVKSGQPVILVVSVENVGKEPLSMGVTCPFLDYSFIVNDSQGRLLHLSPSGARLADPAEAICPRKNRILETNQIRSVNLELSNLFDMIQKGAYTIRVSRKARDAKGRLFTGASRPLEIVIE